MTLADLIQRFRVLANDKVKPYFWADEDVTAFINEAQAEAAIRGRLILTGPTIEHDRCVVDVTAGEPVYDVPDLVYELERVWIEGPAESRPLLIRSPEVMNRSTENNWRDHHGEPGFLVQADRWLRLAPTPKHDAKLYIEGYRRPETLSLNDKDDVSPEINPAHHRHLINWALYQAFNIPDAEGFDPARSQQALAEFTQYFGLRPDSDLRRTTREDQPHHVEAFWP